MVNRHPEVNEAMIDAREELLDLAETKVFAAVAQGNLKICCWVLERLGKHRGYTKQITLAASGPSPQELAAMSDDELNRYAKEMGCN